MILCFIILYSYSYAAVTVVGTGKAVQQANALELHFPLNQSTPFTSFRLDNPPRLVVDIPNAQLKNKVRSLPISSNSVQSVRLGTQQGTDLRIVVDLTRPLAGSTRLDPLKAGFRLVIRLGTNETPSPQGTSFTASSQASQTIAVAQSVRKKTVTIVIDPGHGGKDPGAVGPNGTYEKTVVLAIAKRLRDLINRESGMRAIMTREGDRFIPLRDRVRVATANKADMFISIHADAASSTASGSSVYILSTSGASSEAARLLANSENAADLVGGGRRSGDEDLLSMLIDMSQEATIESSSVLGKHTLNSLRSVMPLHSTRVERAGFAVLKAPDIPSILVETAYISNPQEERKLKTTQHQQALAESIMRGIRRYFADRPATTLVMAKNTAPIQTNPVPIERRNLPPSQVNPVPATSATDAPSLPPLVLVGQGQQSTAPAVQQQRQTAPVSAKTYTTKPNETLADIAKRLNINLSTLKQLNQLESNRLRVPTGTLLRLP